MSLKIAIFAGKYARCLLSLLAVMAVAVGWGRPAVDIFSNLTESRHRIYCRRRRRLDV